MSCAILWRVAAVVLLVLPLGGCVYRQGEGLSFGGIAEPLATLSPHLALFRANGFDLPDGTQISEAFTITLDRRHYEILEYAASTGSGLQIKNGDTLLDDPDVAFEVLLSYAWTAKYHGISGANLASLRALQLRMQNAEEEYQAFFRFAESLAPVMQKVDELKGRQITRIPTVTVRGWTIIDIANWWDLICTIPIDIFDLCLLEPLLREIHEQGVEIEQLLGAANQDLLRVTGLLEAQADGETQNGLSLKESMEKTISGLENLLWKLDQFQANVTDLQAITREAIWVLENREWGPKVDKVLSLLESASGLESADAIDELLIRLRDLDQRIGDYLEKADEISADIEASLGILMAARVRTDEALHSLGEQWRLRPDSE